MLVTDAFVLAAFGLFLLLLLAAVARLRRPRTSSVLANRYEFLSRVGTGGMGNVYRAWDRTAKREVAVKRLRPEFQGNARQRERLLIEACLLSALRHPNIVSFLGAVGDGGAVHLLFEFVEGRTLHARLNEAPGRRLPPARALEILSAAAAAVDHAHGRGVIHRDLKPSNILIADDGRVKIMDFGIAGRSDPSLSDAPDAVVGTPAYMAPEQAQGTTGAESDLYSLGVSFYEMLTGRLPFSGPDENSDKLSGRFAPPSRLVPELPAEVDAVLARALAARPEDRYRSGAELARAAAAALASVPGALTA
jgi:serine/threonine-protein kinase